MTNVGTTEMLHADTVVVGSGSAGCTVAGRLAERSAERVILLEAGPDYGHREAGRWPAEMLDASQLPLTHEWGLATTLPSGRRLALDRAKVIGGCSSHNGCQVVLGHRLDYDGWAAAGNPGWAADDLRPFIAAAVERLRVRRYAEEEITPFHQATLAALEAAGIPRVDDLNDLDGGVGVAPNPANIVDGVRWNSAFAYLDPVRDSPTFTIVDRTLCDRVLLDGDRAVGVAGVRDGREVVIHADRVVLSAGAYGSPAILQRSGVGDPARLSQAAIAVRHELPGVGANLQDHPAIELRFAGTPELVARTRAFAEQRFHPEEQGVAKLRSSACGEAFDLQITTQGGARRAAPDDFYWEYMAAVLTARSRGRVDVVGDDPAALPRVDHGFLTDPDGADLEALADGLALAREICGQEPLRTLLGEELLPGDGGRARQDVVRACQEGVVHAYHPGGTCKMGPADDPDAVVDSSGRVHGLEGLWVADASVMPVLPRANTHLPTVVVAERIAAELAPSGSPLPSSGARA